MLHGCNMSQVRRDSLLPVAHGSETTGCIGKLECTIRICLGPEQWYQVVEVAGLEAMRARKHNEMRREVVRGMLIDG